MRGIPNSFNTADDVKNSLALDKEATRRKLKELLDGRFIWVETGRLEEGETGLEDAMHRVVTSGDNPESPERIQLELREDPHAWLFRIGLDVPTATEHLEV